MNYFEAFVIYGLLLAALGCFGVAAQITDDQAMKICLAHHSEAVCQHELNR